MARWRRRSSPRRTPSAPGASLSATARARPTEVVINERSTVAVGFALAQFLERGKVSGNLAGMRNGGATSIRSTGSRCGGPQDLWPGAARAQPSAWTIALKFLGDGRLNGLGAFEIDADGDAWLTSNYTPGGPKANVCPGKLVFKFTPTGQTFPGSPYGGGGIQGEGFGITFDPKGRLWLGNFGFQSPVCAEGPDAASNISVSLLRADGRPLSPAKGLHRRQDLLAAGHRFRPARQFLDRQLWQRRRHDLPGR